MLQYDLQYPQYGIAQHKGYGVPAHLAAIRLHGPSDIHRRSFEPVKGMLGWMRPGTVQKQQGKRGRRAAAPATEGQEA